MKNKLSLLLIAIAIITLSITSCSCNKKKYNVDVSGIKADVRIERFDKDFLDIREGNPDSKIKLLRAKYPIFFPFIVEQMLQLGKSNDTSGALRDSILAFLSNRYNKRVFDTTEIVYRKIDDIKSGLEEGLKHYRYYFPQFIVPTVDCYLGDPNSGIFTYGDSLLGIGLVSYLGSDYWYYYAVQPPIPQFIIRRLSREYIVPNAMQVIATNYFPYKDDGKKLLDEMIYNGKLYFLLNHILPDTPDSLIVGYRGRDLKWCNENEPEIWRFFIKNNLLYETDQLVYKKFVNDGPNTGGMPPEAPGNIASWVGWRIIQRYAEKHPELSLMQIMREQDSQKILTDSKYKP